MNEQEHLKQSHTDHDLLVRMDEKLNFLVAKNSDHEMRLRRLEMWGGIALGLSYALQFYFNFLR